MVASASHRFPGHCPSTTGRALARLCGPVLPLLLAVGCAGLPPDDGPPAVTSLSPAPGDGTVSVHAPIEATFSEAIAAGTINDSSIVVSGSGSLLLPKTLQLSGDGTRLAIVLDSTPVAPDTITVTLSDSITDLAGNPLTLPADDWIFALPIWVPVGGALSANDGATDTDNPALAVDGSGNPVVAWQERADEPPWDIHVRRWEEGSWRPVGSEPLSANDGTTDARGPSLVLDSSGDPVVAWHEQAETSYYNVYVHRWTGSGWSAVGDALSVNAGATDASNASLALDGSDNPVVAWLEHDGATRNVYVRRWDGDSWAPVGTGLLSRNPDATSAGSPSLALDGSGYPVVAWHEQDGTTTNVYVERWNGSDWSTVGGTLSATGGSTNAVFPSLALDSSGLPTVAWHEQKAGGTTINIFVWRWDGSAWQPLGNGLTANGAHALDPSLVIDGSGRPSVSWTESNGTNRDVHVGQWDGGEWTLMGGSLSAIEGDTDADAQSLSVAQPGIRTVAWGEYDGIARSIHVRRENR
ncbi:MAG: Ig-like domain-containing protein [Trueperaceae bacterium]